MKSISAGCGGNINLSSTSSQSFKTQTGSTYDSLEDCHWIVSAVEGKNIKFTINSMDVRNSTNRTGNGCTDDYIEVKFHSFVVLSVLLVFYFYFFPRCPDPRWSRTFQRAPRKILWKPTSTSHIIEFQLTFDPILQRWNGGRSWSQRNVGNSRW